MTNTAMAVKEVNFNGDTLMAAQEGNSIYTVVKRICEHMQMSRGQVNNEVSKVQTDLVLKQGARNLMLPTSGGKQETLCILIDFLPLWLAKIRITPNMKKNNPALAEKLIQYQLKAKDVLAAAFLPSTPTNVYDTLLVNLNENQRLLTEETKRIDEKITQHIATYYSESENTNESLLSITYDFEKQKATIEQQNKKISEMEQFIENNLVNAGQIEDHESDNEFNFSMIWEQIYKLESRKNAKLRHLLPPDIPKPFYKLEYGKTPAGYISAASDEDYKKWINESVWYISHKAHKTTGTVWHEFYSRNEQKKYSNLTEICNNVTNKFFAALIMLMLLRETDKEYYIKIENEIKMYRKLK